MSTEYVDVTFAVTGERLTDDERESLAVAFEAWCTAAGREPVTMATNPRDPAERDRRVAEQALRQAARLVRLVWTGNTNLPDLNDQEVAYSFDVWLERLADAYRADSAAPDERELAQRYTTVLANLNREQARAVAAEAALAARPAPAVNAADVEKAVHDWRFEHYDAPDGEEVHMGSCVLVQDLPRVLAALGLTVADEGRAEA